MALPEDLLEINMEQSCTDNTVNDISMKVMQARMNSHNPDSDPKVTVTIPKSHLDFLNMIFPPSPQNSPISEDTDVLDEDILIATPLKEAINMVIPTTEPSPQPVGSSTVASDTTYLPFTDKLTNILASTGPLTVQANLLCDKNKSVPLNTNYDTARDKCNNRINTPVALSETIPFINQSSLDTTSAEVVRDDVIDKSQNNKVSKKPKRLSKSLSFPPCNVCGGKATGLHYGVNSCEACKGFFRRYLLKKTEYRCNKEGKCEVILRSRGICSGCRLRKCLNLGMSKERVQMGRYTTTKRTEAIKNMNKMKVNDVENISASDESQSDAISKDVSSELIGKQCCTISNQNQSKGFSMALVEELTQAMLDMKPFGPDITTEEQLEEKLRSHYEYHRSMFNLYGERKPVPREEHQKLYNEFSIDVDGRMEELKECLEGIEEMVKSYCKFAKHIPGFDKLPYKDQSNLLKTSRADVYILLLHKGYSAALGVYVDANGKGYHIDDSADKFMSRDVWLTMGDLNEKWQKLKLRNEETALLMAIVLMYQDRCNTEKQAVIESIQQSLVDLLINLLRKTHKSEGSKRFTKMIDVVISMRIGTEMCLKEYRELCNDKVLVEEFPMLTEFLVEDDN